MSHAATIIPTAATDLEIHQLLQQALPLSATGPGTCLDIVRRPSTKRSSFALEEVDVKLGDGAILQLLYKDLSADALSDAARRAKPCFLYDPHREIAAYRSGLSRYELGAAGYYGAIVNDEIGRYGLLLERVDGVELYQVAEFATWCRVAHWLASFHGAAADQAEDRTLPLLRYDADFYRLWPRRALAFQAASGKQEQRRRLQHLVDRYDAVVERMLALPATLIHGEFYASNIIVGRGGDELRICPVDFEMAAAGPGLIDVAALVAGRWTEDEKKQMLLAYAAGGLDPVAPANAEHLTNDLACCRLHVAMQWLGWSADWSPPPEQASDWLTEAIGLAERLSL